MPYNRTLYILIISFLLGQPSAIRLRLGLDKALTAWRSLSPSVPCAGAQLKAVGRRGIQYPYPIGSKDRKLRMAKIAQELAKNDFDLVSLQEVWDEADFHDIAEIVKEKLPFSHYFHSGYLGSGVCVFSRYQIMTSLMHRYSLNGFAHHIHRGDWFGGKVAGLVQVKVPLKEAHILVNLYATHVSFEISDLAGCATLAMIHAEYSRSNDLYWPHRVVQAYELSQFIRHTNHGSHISLVVGDMNMEEGDLGYRLVMVNAQLRDSWLQKHKTDNGLSIDGNSCDRPDNVYTSPVSLKTWPTGKRIDYIMYKSNKDGVNISVQDSTLRLNKIPDAEINYSDHVAVESTFRIDIAKDNSGCAPDAPVSDMLRPMLEEAVEIVSEGEKRVNNDRKWFMAVCVTMVIILLYSITMEINYPALVIMALSARFLLTLIIGFSLWYGLIGLALEEKALKAAKTGLRLQLSNL